MTIAIGYGILSISLAKTIYMPQAERLSFNRRILLKGAIAETAALAIELALPERASAAVDPGESPRGVPFTVLDISRGKPLPEGSIQGIVAYNGTQRGVIDTAPKIEKALDTIHDTNADCEAEGHPDVNFQFQSVAVVVGEPGTPDLQVESFTTSSSGNILTVKRDLKRPISGESSSPVLMVVYQKIYGPHGQKGLYGEKPLQIRVIGESNAPKSITGTPSTIVF